MLGKLCCPPMAIQIHLPYKSITKISLPSYHHRLEFLPLVAHCKQCLVEDTTAQVPQTFLPQSLHAKGLCSTAPPMSISISTSISSRSLCNGVSQSSHRVSCDRVWSCCTGIEKMGWTGGAGSCFQKECSVDFCGFDDIEVGCWCVGSASDGMGEASG